MKFNLLKTYLVFFTALYSPDLNAQLFTELFTKLNNEYRQEKVYLQVDRTLYNPGETIWFKAYLFAGNFPSQISKTLYTELTDAKGKLLRRTTSPVIMSGAAGSIEIPRDVSGTVFVRSYTKWMLNFDSSFLYTKAIPILAPQKDGKPSPVATTQTNPLTAVSTSSVIQFFPEGGDLVQDIESRVAFKSTDQNGIPVNITGEIIDLKGEKITTFKSIHDGMGIFILKPRERELYKAIWKDAQGGQYEKILPAAKPTGIVLEAGYRGSQLEFKIKRSGNSPVYPYVNVIAQMNQQLMCIAKADLEKSQVARGIIPTENSPAGIVHITALSPDGKPLAERIIFANLIDYSFIASIDASIIDTGRRKKNIIRIDVPDTVPCNLSIAVTDAGIDAGAQEDNIYSRLLLTSDIKGYVFNPAYYFSNYEDSVADHLDLVMMTNGWRRFKWDEILAGHFPELKYLPENYISISGQVHGLNKTMLAGKELNAVLELKDKHREFLNTPVLPEGKFNFEGMVFYDTAKLFYQFNKDKNKSLTSKANFDIKSDLLANDLYFQKGSFTFYGSLLPDTATLENAKEIFRIQQSELELHKIKTLKKVEVVTRVKSRQQQMDEEYTSGFFSNGPGVHSRTILPEDDPAFLASQNLFSYLQNRIAGLQISIDGNDASITWRGIPTSLFVDEVPQSAISFNPPGKLVENPSYILSLPMSEIAMVKIFDPPFFGAGSVSYGGQGGAISVYLKKGNERTLLVKGLDYITVPGYTAVREFYSPDYSTPDRTDIPDYRSTLYWNPFVVTDKNKHQAVLHFYNNDYTKKMKIIIEGCREDGKLIRIEKILE